MNPVMEQLPESKRTSDVEAALSALKISDMGSLADALVSSHSLQGEAETIRGQLGELKSKAEGMVAIPGDSSSDEEKAAFNKAIGIPESATEYGLADISATEEGKRLLNVFLGAGVPKGSAGKLMEGMTSWQGEIQAASESAREDRMAQWKASLGGAADKTVALAERGAGVVSPGEDKAEARTRLLSDPDLAPVLARIGQASTEHPRIFQTSMSGSKGSFGYPSMDDKGIK